MFTKVLIANRGEIACRVIRTLHEMRVATVAVYSEADVASAHVGMAGEAVLLGPAPAADSYLKGNLIIEATLKTGAQAIHPGYGFLSENPDFAQMCADAGVVFIGPTPDQMRSFGLKHSAREIAARCGVPMAPGSGLLETPEAALAAAREIGFPIMLKATAGGGGIGMRLCHAEIELAEAFAAVQRLGKNNFKHAGLYLEKYIERARHIEVQIFGNGLGKVLAYGERDCSAQRRNQKVIEETPALRVDAALRRRLFDAAVTLGQAVNYQSAGTVEFIFDADTDEFYFLEVNTRLQVEHTVTEEVVGQDLVATMLLQAVAPLTFQDYKGEYAPSEEVDGHAIQVRLYAEDPAKNFQPSSGLLTDVYFPPGVRVDTWVATGTEITSYYDPLIAKLIVHAGTREQAVAKLRDALAQVRLAGIETNLHYLRDVIEQPTFAEGRMTTGFLNQFRFTPATIDVLKPGTQTTVQDYPGRIGYWAIGVPPSGPMDGSAFRMANRIVGNPAEAAGLECTVMGLTLRFNRDTTIAITGADMGAKLDGRPVVCWEPVDVAAGSTLELKAAKGGGARAYVAFAGGLDVPAYMGSRATFTLGKFGGHGGRALRAGDVLRVVDGTELAKPHAVPADLRPHYVSDWDIRVLYGPHGAPDFFTPEDVEMMFSTKWKVHHHSDRTGVRLIGPHPTWARTDGGEAGLHPSNIHDNAYAVGTIDFTGNLPIILGPDGPSLGGFVCPATIIHADLWKTGQLKAGDTVRFVPVTQEEARAAEAAQEQEIPFFPSPLAGEGRGDRERPGDGRRRFAARRPTITPHPDPLAGSRHFRSLLQQGERGPEAQVASPILHRIPPSPTQVEVVYRQDGDKCLLVEYGPLVLDLNLRFRVHALMTWLERSLPDGIIDLTPGIRSLHVHFDSRVLPLDRLMDLLIGAESKLSPVEQMEVPTRVVHLPLSWDDPATQLAIQKYMQVVRADAPWCPSNIEFIRRINGLESIEQVREIVYSASYLVMGLGDVYLGAPVATPLDPRHRLVTTKYNPARTWTPENAVGIGGAYLCVYGMEGPGGYQFVGRTVQMWNPHRQTADFTGGKPWLLRFFDQLRFYPVSAAELLKMRQDFPLGRLKLEVTQEAFSLAAYNRFLRENQAAISAFKAGQQNAFHEERDRWERLGLSKFESATVDDAGAGAVGETVAAGLEPVFSEVTGNMWKVLARKGQAVREGERLAILESMKTEIEVLSPAAGRVVDVFCEAGRLVSAGQLLFAIEP